MNRRTILGSVVAAVTSVATMAALLAPTPAGADPGDTAVDRSTADGTRAELLDLYGSILEVIDAGAELDLPFDRPASVDELARQLDRVPDADLAGLGALTDRVAGWDAAADSYASTANALTAGSGSAPPSARASASASPSPSASSGARTSAAPVAGPSAAAGMASALLVPAIPPPPLPFVPTSPVEATETQDCPEVPPGQDVGNRSIYLSNVATSAISAVVRAIPAELHATVFLVTLTFPNPLKIAGELIKGAAEIATRTLEWLRDIYWDCGGVDYINAGPTMENAAIQLYGLADQTNGTVNVVNEGLIVLSDQVDELHRSEDRLQGMRIRQALAGPLTGVVNVAYVLPASEGGFLDRAPVGVQAIVDETLAAARAARLPVSAAAIIYQAQAKVALAVGNYAAAYRSFQRTYQSIGR